MPKGNPQKSGTGNDLHAAARSGDLTAVQSILISNPLAVNSRDKHSRTPLHLAAFSGHPEVVSHLCQHKADVGASAMDDMAAIHFAAQKGHLKVVQALVSAGGSVKAFTRKGMSPLHYAAQGSHLQLVKYLAKKGVSLRAKTKAGKTPLDLATVEEVRSFLEGYERSSKNGEAKDKDEAGESEEKDKAGESDPTAVPLESEGNLSADERPAAVLDEENSEREKRKGHEDDEPREEPSQPKKARVTLSHLQSSDDGQEEEDM